MKVRAAVLREIGRPGPYAETRPLGIEDVELDPPGKGEVLVRIRAAGLCHSDVGVLEDEHQLRHLGRRAGPLATTRRACDEPLMTQEREFLAALASAVTWSIDGNVLDSLRKWADDDLRSLNGQIEFVLRDALRKRGRLREADEDASPGPALPGQPDGDEL